jgi:hypothetical protein
MSGGRRERIEALGDMMPLSKTAQKYAQAVFAAKIQELSHEHDREGSLLKAMVVNQTSLEARTACTENGYALPVRP